MTHKTWKSGVLLLVLAVMACCDAAAWGPRAQRAITATSIQVIRRTFSKAFRTLESNYEADVLRGAQTGPEVLNEGKPFATDAEAISAIANEIGLLREVRKYGFGSYFSYRMGVLSALVADLMLPYALDASPARRELRTQIEADIDAHLSEYSFAPSADERRYIRGVTDYFAGLRTFFEDNKHMIADDYLRGKGYRGYMCEGGKAFFSRAIKAASDAWYTVLRVEGGPGDIPPSPDAVTWYLVDEIRYLLEEKRNFYEAGKVYDNFVRVNPDLMEAYDWLGDLYYAYGTDDARERAVREWRIAYETPSPERRRIARKLAGHYIKVGEVLFERAMLPGAPDEDLPNALDAFTKALQYDQTNDVAASRITETAVEIDERKERRELNVNVIASAEKVMVQAERSAVAEDYGKAIGTYRQAVGLFELINEEFKDQAKTAKDSIKDIKKCITDVINDVLDKASDTIDEGDRAVDEHNFEDAFSIYARVPGILSVIPDDTGTHAEEKADLITLTAQKTDEAKMAKMRWEERKRQEEEAARRTADRAARSGSDATSE